MLAGSTCSQALVSGLDRHAGYVDHTADPGHRRDQAAEVEQVDLHGLRPGPAAGSDGAMSARRIRA